MNYSDYVRLGKELVSKIENYQVKIAEYATIVCDIRHGGRSDNYYTIKDYAQDIGLKYKTVQNWVQVYRNVVVKVDAKIETKEDWKSARITNDILTAETTVKNKLVNRKNRRVTISTPKEKVKDLFHKIQDEEKPFHLEFNRATKSAKHIKYILAKRDLSIIDDESMLHLMEVLDDASEIINQHLTKKR